MRFCTGIHGPQRMNPNDFGDPLFFLQCHHQVKISANISMLTRYWKMVNMANITPAKDQHVSIVVVSMLACSSKHHCANVQPHRALSVVVFFLTSSPFQAGNWSNSPLERSSWWTKQTKKLSYLRRIITSQRDFPQPDPTYPKSWSYCWLINYLLSISKWFMNH